MLLENVNNMLTLNCQVFQLPIELLNFRHYFMFTIVLLIRNTNSCCVFFLTRHRHPRRHSRDLARMSARISVLWNAVFMQLYVSAKRPYPIFAVQRAQDGRHYRTSKR